MDGRPSKHKEFEFGTDHGGVADSVSERSHHGPFVAEGVIALHLGNHRSIFILNIVTRDLVLSVVSAETAHFGFSDLL